MKKILAELVIFHELGHACFDNEYFGEWFSRDIKLDETRANYIASLISGGVFDKGILLLSKFQPGEYKDPFLVSYQFTDDNYLEKENNLNEGAK